MTTTETKYRPILFSGEMVRAILDGRKTQTRRVVKPQPVDHDFGVGGIKPAFLKPQTLDGYEAAGVDVCNKDRFAYLKSPYANVGDRLWVRETWGQPDGRWDEWEFSRGRPNPDLPVLYRTDHKCRDDDEYWRPSIHMPRWASRITLEVTDVRVERLQEISEADAEAEGVDFIPSAPAALTHRTSFARLWDKLNKKRGFPWESNPWVWCVSFRRLEEQNNE